MIRKGFGSSSLRRSRPSSCIIVHKEEISNMSFLSTVFSWRSTTTVATRIISNNIHKRRDIHSASVCRLSSFSTFYTTDISQNRIQRQIFGVKHTSFSTAVLDYDSDDHDNSTSDNSESEDGKTLQKHCKTCTCKEGRQQSISSPHNTCHQNELLVSPNKPLPEPLPNPKYSFKCRSLPTNLIAFNSPIGKQRFLDSLQSNNAEAYFPLSQQFLNQMDPAYCGVTTLILILNALAMDPNVRWRGGWRWYGDESMLLERCCLEEERVRREGITIEQYCGLARCQGVELKMKRPVDNLSDEGTLKDIDDHTKEGYGLDEFRRDIINAVTNPPQIDEDTGIQQTNSSRGCFLVTSFARSALQQTGDGHFSPIAAYHPPTDSCLVLDVARFKYAPYWVDVKDLYDAMIPHDMATDKSRGWILMYPPSSNNSKKNKSMSEGEIEGQRPASSVPLAGSGQSICAMERIKIDYCPAR